MKNNKIEWQDIVNILLFTKFKRIGRTILIFNILNRFLKNAEKNSEPIKKEIKKQIIAKPVTALAFSFIIGWLLAGTLKKRRS